MRAIETRELQQFGLALQGPITWRESYKLYGEHRGTYDNYADGRIIGQYRDDYYFAECVICGNSTKVCPDQSSAVDEHFMHCSAQHDYIYPADKKFKVQDRPLQDVIRIAQEYGLPIPHLECTPNCVRQWIQLTDGSKVVGCGVHEGNKAKVWMGSY